MSVTFYGSYVSGYFLNRRLATAFVSRSDDVHLTFSPISTSGFYPKRYSRNATRTIQNAVALRKRLVGGTLSGHDAGTDVGKGTVNVTTVTGSVRGRTAIEAAVGNGV